jgi:hypothetical protein
MGGMLELFWSFVGKLILDVSLQVFNNEFILLFGYY